MAHDIMQNVWNLYGFQDNPFDTNALRLSSLSPLSIEKAFVSRNTDEKANRLFLNLLGSPSGARIVVEGEIGVGKTTFVNYYRYICQLPKKDSLFTPYNEISLYPSWTVKDFLVNILANLINRLLSEKGEQFIKKDKTLHEILIISKVFLQVDRHTQGSFNAGIVGIGGGYGEQTSFSLPNISEIQLFIYFQKIVEKIKQLGYRGVFLHMDNLELPSRKNPEMTKNLFENIRDSLQIPNVYYVFVSYKGFFYQIISPLERVKSIFFSYPIWIKPLTLDEVFSILQRRYQLLSIRKKYTPPVEEELIEYLHKVYNGKIRFIMDAISSLVYHTESKNIHPIKLEEGRNFLQKIITEKVQNLLTQKEWETLYCCINKKIFQNIEVSESLKAARQNINRAFNTFLELNLIYPHSKEGTKTYYAICEELSILSPDVQTKPITVKKISKPHKLNQRQQKAISFVKEKGSISIKDYITLTDTSRSTAKRDIADLIDKNIFVRNGNARAAIYCFSF